MSASSPPSPSGPVSPWRRMWTAPATTLLNMLQFGQGDAWVWPLLLGGGVLSSLVPQVRVSLAQMLPAQTDVLTVALVGGVLLGLLQALAWPPLLQGVSRLLGGQGSLRASRLAAAWSSLPVLVSYLLAPLGGAEGSAPLGLLSLLLSVWTLTLLVQALAAGQRLTPARAVLGVLLAGAGLLAVLFVVGVVAALVLVLLGVTPAQFQMPRVQ